MNNNLGSPLLRMAVHAALTGGAIAATIGTAQAQQAPASTSDTQLQEVVVTGSRIAVPNNVSISPVTFVTAAQIQETGITRVEDLLNQLPQVFASQGSNVVNGSDGTATVDLRGLNAKRTLVLVDGHRLGPGDPSSAGASDVDMIPEALISNIEVLTGGASSTYGADAVAGVVNFKLDQHFEGVKLIYNGGFYNHSNGNTAGVQDAISTFNTKFGANFAQAPSQVNPGAQQELSFIAGLNSADGKGNATFYATYRHVNAALQSDYSVSACTLGSGFSGKPLHCAGSSTNPFGRFLYFGTPSSDTTLGPNNTLIPFAGSGHLFNYGPLNYFQRPDERYTAGAFLHYDFNDHVKVYANSMFMDDRTIAQIAPSGDFGNTNSVNCANPFLTTAELNAWCAGSTAGNANGLYILRRNVEGGNRQDDLQHTDFREVLGARGDINDVWQYDASYQFSMVNRAETYYNDVSVRKLQNALDVVSVNGVPTCQSVINGTDPQCVPYNVFQLGGVTPAAVAYLSTPGLQRGQIKTHSVDVNFTGDLAKYGIQLPHTDSGLQVNGGVDWRDETSFFEPDQEFQSGDLAGQGGATLPLKGGIVSREAFFETHMPLVDHMTGAQAIDFDTGYRYSDYNLGFKTNTFKLGLDWKPVDDVRLRASFARASRAPNIGELFSTQSVALDGNTDPCSGTTPTYTQAQCALTGVT
ncbi:MAG: TonB-dependent receptor, partial [Gammaproteobacteria bacterium]|nr:TonB-dependent receptor [Gammaproteobacteria bacterium]